MFVRTSGCNLRCHWCDTPFTSWEPVGDQRSVAEVAAAVAAFGLRHAVITGGEPMLFPEVAELCRGLRAAGQHVTIETAGLLVAVGPTGGRARGRRRRGQLRADRHEVGRGVEQHRARRLDRHVLPRGPYPLKFVIDTPADLAEAVAWLGDLEAARPEGIDRSRVLFLPQGRGEEELARTTAWLEPEGHAHGIQLAHRFHIEW
ncbi:MAG: radical SAM protein, partial [Planctomycetia bacterium]